MNLRGRTRERLNLDLRQKITHTIDHLLTALVLALLLGSARLFGGAVWWFRPAVAVLASLLVVLKMTQLFLSGRMPFLKSPLTLLGLLFLALGVLQLVPMPEQWAKRLSSAAHEIYASGGMPSSLKWTILRHPQLSRPIIARRQRSTVPRRFVLWL